MNESILMGIDIWRKNFGNATSIFMSEFVHMFKSYISQYAKIFLDHDQLNFLISLVDPSNSKTLNFIEYIIFFENFWLIPSKRMRLFKHKYPESPARIPITPKTIHFTITNNLTKEKKELSYELMEDQILTVGNDIFSNNLTIKELRNKLQLGLGVAEGGVSVRDYGKGCFRAKIKISNDKFSLEEDMMVRLGKETSMRVKKLSPHRLCDGKDRKHRVLQTKFIGLDDEMRSFFEINKNEDTEIRDVNTYRNIKDKRDLENKVFQKIEEKFIEIEIYESGINSRNYTLIPKEEKTEFLIGRGTMNKVDIMVTDMSVSKKQCKISFEKNCGWVISEVLLLTIA